MTPAARLQAVIDLLTEIDETPRPADAIISAFFRARRFIGSKDRTAIAETTYAVLRHHARLRWWLARTDSAVTPRLRLIAYLSLVEGKTTEDIAEGFSGAKFAPARCDDAEKKGLAKLDGQTLAHPDMPEAVAVECPPWVEDKLRTQFGDRFPREMQAMLDSAPLDLRVNIIKATREDAIERLAAEGVETVPCRLSPVGLRAKGRPALGNLAAFKDGLIEIQDEGSQLVGLLVNAQPGMRVVDFCAGAGGKTLAMAAMMQNKGRIIACDVLDKRLQRAAERFRRAGLHNIEVRALANERDPWVKKHKEGFDRVLTDVPCSGTGTWRRNPDARWKKLGPGLPELVRLQAEILDSAARLVKPGGRLIYATCSLLPDENDDQIKKFLATHDEFALVPISQVWAEAVGGHPVQGEFMNLTPGRHRTDGFFTAVIQRKMKDVQTPDE